MKRNPLLVIGLPRSGTSFIAGVFVNHGFWYGNSCNIPSEKRFKGRSGYYENKAVQHFMLSHCKTHPLDGGVNGDIPDFKKRIEKLLLADGYKDNGMPWLVKMGACHVPPWLSVYSYATIVVVRRPLEVIKKSNPKITQAKINSHLPIMDNIERGRHGFRIDYNRVMDGDYSQFEAPLAAENIEFKKEAVDKLLRKNLRHYV